MNGRQTEIVDNTDEQVREYVSKALALVTELNVPHELRPTVFERACNLYASKQVVMEVVQAGADRPRRALGTRAVIAARFLAATCFVWAAYDGPAWKLDRAGVALVGLAFLALALRPLVARVPASAGFGFPGFPPTVPDDVDAQLADLVGRVNQYGNPD